MNHFKKIFIIGVITLLMVGHSFQSHGQNEKMKGVQIFKVALNTTFPDPGDKFVIGVYGESSVFFVLSAISRARKIGNSVVFVKKVSTPAQILACEIVFVTDKMKSDQQLVKKIIKEKDILLISEESLDVPNFDINLFSKEQRVSYEVNAAGLNKRITLSEKLITEAAKVY